MPIKPNDSHYSAQGTEAQFVDARKKILINKLGITNLRQLQIQEEEGLVDCYQQMIKTVKFDTPLSTQLIKEIHYRIFGKIFEWAGRWRHSWISKGEMVWPNPEFLGPLMEEFEQNILKPIEAKRVVSDREFCQSVAKIQGEFLTIHPFREGNARTIKVLTDLYAAQTGRPFLLYDDFPQGKEKYIQAAIAAFKYDFRPMENIIFEALDTALNQIDNGKIDAA